MNAPVTIVTMKWGDKYPPHYVNRLHAGARRNMARSFRFVCFTEKPEGVREEVEVFPLPEITFEAALVKAMAHGAFRKLTMLQPGAGHLSGLCLWLDLDVVVTGQLDPLFDYHPDKLCMARHWTYGRRGHVGGQGSAIRFDPDRHRYLYDELGKYVNGELRWRGEQEYTSMTAQEHGDLQYFPDEWIRSFKHHSRASFPLRFLVEPKLPPNCRIMCFSGQPEVHEALAGYHPNWRRRTRPPKWLRTMWLDDHEQDWMPEGSGSS